MTTANIKAVSRFRMIKKANEQIKLLQSNKHNHKACLRAYFTVFFHSDATIFTLFLKWSLKCSSFHSVYKEVSDM